MSLYNKFTNFFKSILPSPLAIAVILTFVTILLSIILTDQSILDIAKSWDKGVWKEEMLVFAFQMMIMMVLGHVLALTEFVNSSINKMMKYCNNTAKSAAIITLLTVIISLFNWGLGLIFGAIFARKVGEYASKNKIKLNYPLIAAAGYSGMMVWHGGISGSAPIKIAEKCHLWDLLDGTNVRSEYIPDMIPLSETIFSPMNLFVSLLLIIFLPIGMYILGRKSVSTIPNISSKKIIYTKVNSDGTSKLDYSKSLSFIFSSIILIYCIYQIFFYSGQINPLNVINLILLSLGILLHRNLHNFTKSIDSAIGGAAGILIQFPLYFGIIGIMKDSGLATMISDAFVNISNETTFPIFTFFSGAIFNIFVPSGGGQWAIQGPIIIEAASNMGISLNKSIMAFSYGDQLTNMLQPFWALPLLWITEVKAKEILPYTLYLLVIGIVIFIGGLLIF